MNIAAWLARAGQSFPDQPATAHGLTVVQTYGRLAERAARLAAGLGKLGLRPGDRVAICAGNKPSYVECLFGAWWGGFAAVPMNAKLHPAELAWMIDNAEAPVCLAGAKEADGLAGQRPEALRHLFALGSADYEALFAADPAPLAEAAPDDLAWLFYTSGTTGRPKGATITHRNLAAMSFAYLCEVDPTGRNDAILHAAPMSHGSGLYIVPHVCRAALNIVPESGGFDAEEIFRLMAGRPGTSMFAAPTMIRRLVECSAEFDPTALRTLVWGGAPMYVADIKRAFQRFGPRLAQIYGQGESPMTITFLDREIIAAADHPQWEARLGSAGIASSACQVRVVDEAGRPLPPGEAGEIVVRGDSVVPGYWRNPDATAETLRGGWLHTGDVGAFSPDGFLTLMDRSKDLIISGGSNIYPREIEEVLLTHPDIREVSVIGRPDPDWGEVVIAYVVGAAPRAALDALCLDRIARFKRPKDYVFVEALPKNNYGKILKTELRKLDEVSRVGKAV